MRRHCFNVLTFLFVASVVFGQSSQPRTISNLELADREIRDILQIFAHELEATVIADATVSGKASYFVRNSMEIERALQVFLDANDLYLTKIDEIYYVSRIRVLFQDSKLTVDADLAHHILIHD